MDYAASDRNGEMLAQRRYGRACSRRKNFLLLELSSDVKMAASLSCLIDPMSWLEYDDSAVRVPKKMDLHGGRSTSGPSRQQDLASEEYITNCRSLLEVPRDRLGASTVMVMASRTTRCLPLAKISMKINPRQPKTNARPSMKTVVIIQHGFMTVGATD
jgi:hypothetical protein